MGMRTCVVMGSPSCGSRYFRLSPSATCQATRRRARTTLSLTAASLRTLARALEAALATALAAALGARASARLRDARLTFAASVSTPSLLKYRAMLAQSRSSSSSPSGA